MEVICGWHIANSILKKSFDDEIYITPLKLNCLVYLLYSKYLYLTGDKLFNEVFEKTKLGPIVPSIYSKFGTLKNNIITRYARESTGKIIYAKNNKLDECLLQIWEKYKNVSDDTILLTALSGMYISKINYGELLKDNEILTDEIYRSEFELERAKNYKKKI